MIWFSADWHFFHNNILQYCNRPYETIEDMNQDILNQYEDHVKPGDDFYFLGDFAFGKPQDVLDILCKIPGRIHLLKGNHDSWLRKVKNKLPAHVTFLGDYYELKVKDEEMEIENLVVLCHYAFEVWNKKHFGAWHLHGHSHGTLPSVGIARMDVGVDAVNYKPISYDEIKIKFTQGLLKKGM